MGFTHIRIEVANPANMDKWETVECLVDSGATYSVIPSPVLAALGIRSFSEQELRFANGEVIRRPRGIAAFRYRDKIGGSDVIFGEDGDFALVGVLTLESLGYALDPMKRELRPLPMILAGVERS